MGPRGDVLHQDVPAGTVRLAVDLMAAGQRGLRVGHDVALGVEPLEGLRAAHALRVHGGCIGNGDVFGKLDQIKAGGAFCGSVVHGVARCRERIQNRLIVHIRHLRENG